MRTGIVIEDDEEDCCSIEQEAGQCESLQEEATGQEEDEDIGITRIRVLHRNDKAGGERQSQQPEDSREVEIKPLLPTR
jgi:hypothetical protein